MPVETGYEKTPSFYNDELFFTKYLGCTSYYKSLQKVVDICVKYCDAKKVLDLGCALGTTAKYIARRHPNIEVFGIDNRHDVVRKANNENMYNNECRYDNLRFATMDMTEFVKIPKEMWKYDFIYMLYSFHHIVDPVPIRLTSL